MVFFIKIEWISWSVGFCGWKGSWRKLVVIYIDKGIDSVEVVSCILELYNDIGLLFNLFKLYFYGGGKNC